MGDWTGTVPSFAAGAKLRGVDAQTLADIATAESGVWSDWTPTLANITQGSGTVVAKYKRVGKHVHYRFVFTLGSGSAIGTSPTFTLPATPHADYVSATFGGVPLGRLWMLDSGAGAWEGTVLCLATNVATLVYSNEVGASSSNTITATAPFTWTSPDRLNAFGTFETS